MVRLVLALEVVVKCVVRLVRRISESEENARVAVGCCNSKVLVVGELPLEVGTLLEGNDLALLTDDDLETPADKGWDCVWGPEILLIGVTAGEHVPVFLVIIEDDETELLPLLEDKAVVGLLVGVVG